MAPINLNMQISVIILKEKNRFVAHSPALDLSTSGKTFRQTKKRFSEAGLLLFEEIMKRGTVDEALRDLGWTKRKKNWQPPIVVSQNLESISIPLPA